MRTTLLVITLVVLTGRADAKPCIAPTRADLAGAWIADADDDVYLLDLDENGTGVLVQASRRDAHSTYKVSLATLESRRIAFQVKTISALSKALYIRGTTCRDYLWLEIGERNPKWKITLEFRPRDPLLARIDAATTTAEQLKKGRKP